MNIVYQKQIWQEFGYDDFIRTLTHYADRIHEVEIIPFTSEIHGCPNWTPDHVFGSGRLVRLARDLNWYTFPSFNAIDFDILPKEHWLNGDGDIIPIRDFPDYFYENGGPEIGMFVKPYERQKMFTGGIAHNDKLCDQFQFCWSDIDDVDAELVLVALPERIEMEHRFFVIDNKVVAGSSYSKNSRYCRLDGMTPEWRSMEEIILPTISRPFSGVVDTTVLRGGKTKVIEMNNLNSSGIYACDPVAIVNALCQHSS